MLQFYTVYKWIVSTDTQYYLLKQFHPVSRSEQSDLPYFIEYKAHFFT